MFPASTSKPILALADLSSVNQGAYIYTFFIVALALPLAIYIVHSVLDLFMLHHGRRVKKITKLTAYLDRRSQAAVRRKWQADLDSEK